MNVGRLSDSIPGRLYSKLGRDGAFNWAVILAWNFLQSLFPIVLVMAAVLGLALGFIGIGSDQVYRTVLSIIPDSAAEREAFNALQLFHQKSGIFFLVGFLLFLCIYYVVPNRRQDWGKVWPGAALSGLLFESLSLLFPLYLRLTGGGSAYGKTFALLFLLMVFFYFLGIVTMVGAELNS